ncbi:DUF5677 domain-containing protein [Bradyrhizobium ganzhouense]|uniref:DUF5677 domain-containing protein n=1 Tax=Bradyrhizobium ganzhouense TaxID=1179767 RepID=UPI003CEEC0F4
MSPDATDQKSKWFAFADELFELASAIYAEADFMETEAGAADPRVIALTLLCRTVGNFRGALSMIEQQLIVEARTLTRSCVENLIWIDKLARDGAGFVKEIVANEYKSREMRGQVLAQWASSQENELPFAKDLHAYLKGIKGRPKELLSVKALAQAGVLKDSYVIYGQLSSDAAHPSADSLGRHIQRNSDHSIAIVADGLTDEGETLQTLDFACATFLSICVGANQIIGGVPSGAELERLFQALIALRQGQSKVGPAAQTR